MPWCLFSPAAGAEPPLLPLEPAAGRRWEGRALDAIVWVKVGEGVVAAEVGSYQRKGPRQRCLLGLEKLWKRTEISEMNQPDLKAE